MAEQMLTAEEAAVLQASGIPIVSSNDTALLQAQQAQQLDATALGQLQQSQALLDPQHQRIIFLGYSVDLLSQVLENLRNAESGFTQTLTLDASASSSSGSTTFTNPDGTTTTLSSSSSSSSSSSPSTAIEEDKKFLDACIDSTRKLYEYTDSLLKSINTHFPSLANRNTLKSDLTGHLTGTTTDNIMELQALGYNSLTSMGLMNAGMYGIGSLASLGSMPMGISSSGRKKARYEGEADDPNGTSKRRRSHTHYVCTLCALGPDGEPRDMQGKRNVRIHFHSKQNDHREQYVRENRSVVEQLVAHGQPPIVIFAGVDTCLSCRGDPKVDDHSQCLGLLIQFLHSIGAQILPGPNNPATMGLSLGDPSTNPGNTGL